MKRSSKVNLVLMTGAAGLTACGDDASNSSTAPGPTFPDVQACEEIQVFTARTCASLVNEGQSAAPAETLSYRDAAECEADGYFTPVYCQAKFNEAAQLHRDHAPAYDNVQACEAAHGPQACGYQQAQGSGGGSFWTPFLTGYLVSNAFNSFNRPQPYYRDNGGYTTVGGYRLGNNQMGRGTRYRLNTDSYRATQQARSQPTNAEKARSGQLRRTSQRTTVAKRQGFGGRSSSSRRGG